MIDLPGNYSLTPYSVEEQVSRDAIIHEENDAVINVIDAENIQRNLYLTLQIMETGANTVLALNMLNYAEEAGFKIDVKKLQKILGIPIVVVDAREGTGLDELVKTAIKAAKNPTDYSDRLTYGFELDDHINQVKSLFPNLKVGSAPDSWVAVKLLEGDDEVLDLAEESSDKNNLRKLTEIRKHLEGIFDGNLDDAFIDARYGEIESLMKQAVKRPTGEKESITDKIDRIVTNKFLGLPIFLLIIFLIFYLTYTVGAPFQDLIDEGWTILSGYILEYLGEGMVSSLLVDGVIGGVGGILTFLPIIFILFFDRMIIKNCIEGQYQ